MSVGGPPKHFFFLCFPMFIILFGLAHHVFFFFFLQLEKEKEKKEFDILISYCFQEVDEVS